VDASRPARVVEKNPFVGPTEVELLHTDRLVPPSIVPQKKYAVGAGSPASTFPFIVTVVATIFDAPPSLLTSGGNRYVTAKRM